MADQSPDPTAWSDDQLDSLLNALAERAAERDDLDLPGSGPSRRTVLATLLGAGGVGLGATQLGAAASWGSASGTLGTDSEPVDTANIRDLDAKLLETEQASINTPAGSNWPATNSIVRSSSYDGFLGDDKAATAFTESIAAFTLTLTLSRAGSETGALIAGSTDNFNDANLGPTFGAETVDITTTNVTGTTGTDGSFTVAFLDGELKVENRVGASVEVSYYLVGKK